MEYTIVVAAASESAALQFIAAVRRLHHGRVLPRQRGMHALIIYDDLSKQAVGLPPDVAAAAPPAGREAYPGDVFYLHTAACSSAPRKMNEFTNGG